MMNRSQVQFPSPNSLLIHMCVDPLSCVWLSYENPAERFIRRTAPRPESACGGQRGWEKGWPARRAGPAGEKS